MSGSTVYAGGQFTTIGGQARNYIAAIDAITGNATSWDPNSGNSGGPVYALAVRGSTVYAGGQFGFAGGQRRGYIAALDSATGSATSWNPNANSTVLTLALSGNTVYAGGYFTSIGGQARNKVVAIDATTGSITSWNPNPNSHVYALAVSGSMVYVGGYFTSISGQSRNYIAALDSATGTSTSWDPHADGDGTTAINALAVSGSTIYAGGTFNSIGGQTRNKIAALDATTGILTSCNPDVSSGNVRALAASGSTVYAGGQFTSIGGQARNNIAALDSVTGSPTSWNPNASSPVLVLAVSGNTVYAGGQFTSIGGQTRNYIAGLDATGSPTSWNPNAGDYVNALAVSGNTVYAGGYFTSIGGQARSGIAALDATTGNATSWNPNSGGSGGSALALAVSGNTVYAGGQFTSIGGLTRNRIAAIDATTGSITSWNPNAGGNSASTVYALAVSGNTVYAGGYFTSISGQTRNKIAALDAATGSATSWNPNASIGSTAVYALAVSGSTVYVGGNFTSMGSNATRSDFMALTDSTNPLGILSAPVMEEAFSLSAFPNPTNEKVLVRANGAMSPTATVQVMSLLGAAVKEVEMREAQTEIDLSGLASGMYLLRYKDAEGRTGMMRILKQ